MWSVQVFEWKCEKTTTHEVGLNMQPHQNKTKKKAEAHEENEERKQQQLEPEDEQAADDKQRLVENVMPASC